MSKYMALCQTPSGASIQQYGLYAEAFHTFISLNDEAGVFFGVFIPSYF